MPFFSFTVRDEPSPKRMNTVRARPLGSDSLPLMRTRLPMRPLLPVIVTSGPSVSTTVTVFVAVPVRPAKSFTRSENVNFAPRFVPRRRYVMVFLSAVPARDHVRSMIGLPAMPIDAAEVKIVVLPSWILAGPAMLAVGGARLEAVHRQLRHVDEVVGVAEVGDRREADVPHCLAARDRGRWR